MRHLLTRIDISNSQCRSVDFNFCQNIEAIPKQTARCNCQGYWYSAVMVGRLRSGLLKCVLMRKTRYYMSTWWEINLYPLPSLHIYLLLACFKTLQVYQANWISIPCFKKYFIFYVVSHNEPFTPHWLSQSFPFSQLLTFPFHAS